MQYIRYYQDFICRRTNGCLTHGRHGLLYKEDGQRFEIVRKVPVIMCNLSDVNYDFVTHTSNATSIFTINVIRQRLTTAFGLS